MRRGSRRGPEPGRDFLGDARADGGPPVVFLVARFGVGGDGDKTSRPAERADLDRAQRLDSSSTRLAVLSRARRAAAFVSSTPSKSSPVSETTTEVQVQA